MFFSKPEKLLRGFKRSPTMCKLRVRRRGSCNVTSNLPTLKLVLTAVGCEAHPVIHPPSFVDRKTAGRTFPLHLFVCSTPLHLYLGDRSAARTRKRSQTPAHRTTVRLLSPFLIGRMFLREPSWKYSEKLVGS